MDLPSSGWYPDPYGTPSLLRWWDGSVWTQHTHPDVSAGGAGASGGEAATALPAATSVQAAAPVHETAVQASPAGPAGTAQQPSPDWLRRTKPPTGRPTQPQPALPDTVAPTAYQPAVTTAAPGAAAPTVVQPGYPQPAMIPAMAGRANGAADGAGTQVLYFGGDPWQSPGGPAGPGTPGGPGMPGGLGLGPGGPGNRYGYQAAQRRRRRWVIGGISAGTAVAVAVIVVVAVSLSGSPSAGPADQTKLTPSAPPTTAAPAPTASAAPSPSASPSPSPTITNGSLLSDGQAGLSYSQLPAPWAASCPASLNDGTFTWTDGEYATAGPVNGNSGPVTWYGEACSGPLPSSYGYTSTAQLQNTAQTLAGNFANAYYSDLDHNTTPEENQSVEVSGHQGWEITWDVTYTNAAAQGITWADEQAAVVVVDTGTGGEPAVFFTSVPADLNQGNISTLVSSLQLLSASSTAPATATAAGAGSGNP